MKEEYGDLRRVGFMGGRSMRAHQSAEDGSMVETSAPLFFWFIST